jgi:hypothetical protein
VSQQLLKVIVVVFWRNKNRLLGFNKTTVYSFGGGNQQRSCEVNPFIVECTQSWLRHLCTKLYFENRQMADVAVSFGVLQIYKVLCTVLKHNKTVNCDVHA